MAKRSDFSGLVKNPKMKLVLKDCNHMCGTKVSANYNNRSTWRCVRGCGETDMPQCEKGKCTNGPGTWYRHAGIQLWWWSNPSTATVDEMKRRLSGCGMVAVWHGTGEEANSKLNSSKYLRPGDVASMISSDSAHGVMWTGEDWRSDFWQGGRPYPYRAAGRGGDWTFILWRHPDLQEPGMPVQGDGLGNAMGEGMDGGGGRQREWKDFNLQDFPIKEDEEGKYTEEPILLGIANHLRIQGIGGESGGSFGDGAGISGSSPFASADEFFNKVNWSAAEKYAAGVYRNYKNMVGNRRIRSVPSDFLSSAKAYCSRTGLPVGALVMIGKSESGFKNCAKNSLGYGGYFGSKYGPEGSFDEQADSVLRSFNTAKKFSPGADNLALLVIMYISHGLPVIGSRWWNAMGGKIWCADPDLIMSKMKECYVAGMKQEASAVRYAEHLANQLASQYMALQIKDMNF